MRVNHRRLDALVAQQFLDFADVRAADQQVRGEAVPQRISTLLINSVVLESRIVFIRSLTARST